MCRLFALVLLVTSVFPAFGASPSVLVSRKFGERNNTSGYAVQTDATGNIYVAGFGSPPGFPMVKPIQTTGAIFVAKLDPTGANILYSTAIGTGPGDSLGGMAVDPAGNVYIAGTTASSALYTTPFAIQREAAGKQDIFVTKIDPTGQQIVYATYLGGTDDDRALGIAIDAIGAIYVTGTTASADFPVTAGGNLSDPAKSYVFVTKLVPDGTFLQYSAIVEPASVYRMSLAVTSLTEAAVLVNGGLATHILKLNAAGDRIVYRTAMPASTGFLSIASTGPGFIWAAGTASRDGLATVDAAQSAHHGNIYFRSEDAGATLTAGADGLDAGAVTQIVAVAGSLYSATDSGVFRSGDRGLHWHRLLGDRVIQIAADPSAAGTLYVARIGATPLAKTTDGGTTWIDLDPQVPAFPGITAVAVDPSRPSTVYAGGSRVYRSDDGGMTWTASDPVSNTINSLAVDPANSSIVYASMSPQYVGCGIGPCIPVSSGIMRSTDGGRTFQGSSIINFASGLMADAAHPGTVYSGGVAVLKTTDFGAHWNALRVPFFAGGVSIPVSLDSSGAVYVQAGDGSLYRSDDGGSSFAQISSFPVYGSRTFVVADGVIHIGAQRGPNTFVAKLDLSGNITYATYWGGRAYESANGIAVDPDGMVYVTGSTQSPDFPERNEVQEYNVGNLDAFVLKLDPDGGVVYSTTWGGSGSDQGLAIGAGPGGRVFVVGQTYSPDFPRAANQPGTLFLFGLQ
jgi:photosystem II stability/assembly factor-like uncharacterized protein